MNEYRLKKRVLQRQVLPPKASYWNRNDDWMFALIAMCIILSLGQFVVGLFRIVFGA